MTRTVCALLMAMLLLPTPAAGQTLVASRPHGWCEEAFRVAVTPDAAGPDMPDGAVIRFTRDGSEPTPQSEAYTDSLHVAGTTLLRAAAFADTVRLTPTLTVTWLFMADVLAQGDAPEGYPTQWGQYATISGTATADYGMDPEMTGDATLRPRIAEGLMNLPVLSIVTDRDNLFSHERDSVRGGIYIFTGPPVGDATGHGWTRPTSAELFGGPQRHDLTVDCGLRLHGGHGRLAEKNPKHSLRLVFKKQYGPGTLRYNLYGPDGPDAYNQLVVRCHFGNAWQHWDNGNRQRAQYTRDVWARRMQRRMGHTAVDALYVHVFLNGMYWGVYNIAERVDDQFGKNYLGGKKTDIDVIKVEESGGNHLEASEGDMEAWQALVATASQVGARDDDAAYLRLQGLPADGADSTQAEPLLDVDAFIDYMLLNQYGGNTDWDHHNWYAIRRRGPESQGFRFLCWDSEIIFENVNENVLKTNNGDATPTGILRNLLRNHDFARRYLRRAREVLAADGLLGEGSVVALWDSLSETIRMPLYAEAARWGDYRRDVHRWQSAGTLYTVDGAYMAERSRLLSQYFPQRSARVLADVERLADVDDWEAPADWVPLERTMFCRWSGTEGDAYPLDVEVGVDWNFEVNMEGGTAIAGFVGVQSDRYADLSDYERLVLRGSGGTLRLLANRQPDQGPWKQVNVTLDASDAHWDDEMRGVDLPLDELRTALTSEGLARHEDFLHLNAIKVDWSSTVYVREAWLVPAQTSGIEDRTADGLARSRETFDLSGRKVVRPTRGLYIRGGRKVYVR